MLGVEHTVIESVDLEPDGRGGEQLVARVRPRGGQGSRCSRCQRRCPGYDLSKEPRRWRGLDLGTTQVYLQATTRRVSCPRHGVVVAAVPWARAGSRFTTAFEDTTAWLVSPRHPVGGGGAAAHRVALTPRSAGDWASPVCTSKPPEEATGIRRRLAQANPAAHLPDLARGLWGLAGVRAIAGLELPEALAAAEEAIAIYQRLVEEIPEAFGGDLLSARYTLADVLDGLGRHDEAAEVRRQIGGDAAPDEG